MSLLRRIRREDVDEGPAAVFPGEADDVPQDDASVQELWRHRTDNCLLSVAITGDSRFIIAGSQQGEVLFFDITGRLLWSGRVNGAVYRIVLAEAADSFLVGTIDRGRKAHLWHYTGRLLRTFNADDQPWGVDITPDASLIALGSLDQHVCLFDRDANPVFRQTVNGPVRHVSLTADGARLFASTDDGFIYAFDRSGEQLWRFRTLGRAWAGVGVAEAGSYLVAGSNDQHIYALDFDGEELWRFDTGGKVNRVAVTPDGAYSAAVNQANTAMLFNRQGQLLWDFQAADHIYGLALSPDGRFMLLGSNDNRVYLVDHEHDHRVWRHQTRGPVHGVAVSPDGRTFAVAATDKQVITFGNTTMPPDPQKVTRLDSVPLMRLIVQRVRDEFVVNTHAGLVSWFSEFERSLRHNQFDVCRALLREVHDDNTFGLSEEEQKYTRSLEGAYWLFRGIAHHRLEQHDLARTCYEKSQAIQSQLNNRDGLGQVLAALSVLPDSGSAQAPEPADPADAVATDTESTEPEPDPRNSIARVLDEIANRPRVLGTSETLLTHRIRHVPPDQQLQIVLAAKQSGLMAPMIVALESDESVIRAAASAALTLLEPGPSYDILHQMLSSSQPFVRWQALRILRHRARNQPNEFKAQKDQFWAVALTPEEGDTSDPLALREEALLVGDGGDETDTVWLLSLLKDSEPDVQIAAVQALGEVGNRDALPLLKKLPGRTGFLGQSLTAAAAEAIDEIVSRHPTPSIGRIVFCQDDPLQNQVVQQHTLFKTGVDAIFAIVTTQNAQPGTEITARWLLHGRVVKEEVRVIAEDDQSSTIAAVRDLPLQSAAPPGHPAPRPSRFSRDFEDADQSRQSRFSPPPPLASRERNAPETRFRPGHPAFASDNDSNVAPPAFLRDRVPRGQSDSPFGRQPQGHRPPLARPRSPFDRDDDRVRRARPGRRMPAQPPVYENHDPDDVEPQPDVDPVGLFLGLSDQSESPAPPSFQVEEPEEHETPDIGLLRRLVFGRREPPRQRPASIRRRQPSRAPRGRTATRREPATRAGSAIGRRAFPGRPDSRPPAPPFRRPRRERRVPSSEDNGWLDWLDDPDVPLGRVQHPVRLPGRPVSPSRRRPFGDPEQDRFPARRRGGERAIFERPSARRSGVARRYVLALPRPEDGWQPENYKLEVAVNGDAPKAAQFKIIDRVNLLRLEPGVPGQSRRTPFDPSRVFLTGTQYIDCLVHLTDAPFNTAIRGQLHSIETGTLLGETTAMIDHQDQQTVQLTWENPGWIPGRVRLTASVDGESELHTEIKLLDKIKAEEIVLCHQVDRQNGPIGAGWPFYPGDTCFCVVSLPDSPPGIELQASWYHPGTRLPSSGPYRTQGRPNLRAVFELKPPARENALKPGHYSVIIHGQHVTREERVFEILPAPGISFMRRITQSIANHVTGFLNRTYLDRALVTAAMTFAFALALLLAGAASDEILPDRKITSDVVLNALHNLNRLTPAWVIGWGIGGLVYGIVHTRDRRGAGGDLEDMIHAALNMALVGLAGAVMWYQVVPIGFGPGHRWPQIVDGLFADVLWLEPLVAWLAVPVGLALAGWMRRKKNQPVALLGPVYALAGLAGLMLLAYAGAFALGFSLGSIGWVLDSLIDTLGGGSRLGRALLAVGASIGFLVGPIAAGLVAARDEIVKTWKTWIEQKNEHTGRWFSGLHFCRENLLPLEPEEYLRLARIAGQALAVMIATLGVMALILRPVAVPALAFLYDASGRDAFEHLLRSVPFATLISLAAWIAWPLLIHRLQRFVITVDLTADQTRFVRRFVRPLLLVAVAAPLLVLVISRVLAGVDLPPAATIFWANRIATAVLFGLVAASWGYLIWKRPPSVTFGIGLRVQYETIVLGVLAVLGAVLLPIWFWAVVVAAGLAVLAAGPRLLWRMR